MARGASQDREAAHEGAADSKNVKVHGMQARERRSESQKANGRFYAAARRSGWLNCHALLVTPFLALRCQQVAPTANAPQ